MSIQTTNFLRRTFIGLGAGLALAAGTQALAQGSITLSGSTSASCSYSSMTVLPNGNIAVTCGSGQTNPQGANFALSHGFSSNTLAPNTSGNVTVTRTGGPSEPLFVQYSVSGSGCSSQGGGMMMLAGQSQTIPVAVGAAGTNCTVTIGPQSPHTANPGTIVFTAQTGGGGDPGGPAVPPGCPAIPANAVSRIGWPVNVSDVDQLRMESGKTAYYPVVNSSVAQSVVVEFSQGQQGATPGDLLTEMAVSKCPGYIDPTVPPECRITFGFTSFYKMSIWTEDHPSWASWKGCKAPKTDSSGAPQTWYVNVRWTYAGNNCQGASPCGASMQWLPGSTN
jgi:hypothetical protein